jgi:hypothetical protein
MGNETPRNHRQTTLHQETNDFDIIMIAIRKAQNRQVQTNLESFGQA